MQAAKAQTSLRIYRVARAITARTHKEVTWIGLRPKFKPPIPLTLGSCACVLNCLAPGKIFMLFLVLANFLQNQLFQKNYFMNTILASNRLDPDQA